MQADSVGGMSPCSVSWISEIVSSMRNSTVWSHTRNENLHNFTDKQSQRTTHRSIILTAKSSACRRTNSFWLQKYTSIAMNVSASSLLCSAFLPLSAYRRE